MKPVEIPVIRNYHGNVVHKIHLYKQGNTWVFDDNHLNLVAEAFVCGASEAIQFIIDNLDDLTNKLTPTVIFSALPFPDYDAKIDLVEDMDPSGTYKMDLPNGEVMNLWLCSVLNMFFEKAPQEIYIKFIN